MVVAPVSTIDPVYTALALQTRCVGVNGLNVDDGRALMMQSATRITGQVSACKALLGANLRLVVLPEYILTGFPMGESLSEWRALAALERNGPEYEVLQRSAQSSKVYLGFNAYDRDPNFSDLYFQVCVVIGPNGDIVLRYHRLISMFAPSPIDVWDKFLDLYGFDAVFPTADTEIGRLACIASEEILYPEITRMAAMNGAEVLLHMTGEISSTISTAKEICRQARAVENAAYVVSANAASLEAGQVPIATTDGMSKIIDDRGLVLAAAGQGETLSANSEIDLGALRRRRRAVGMSAMLARIPSEAVGLGYQGRPSHPSNTLLDANGELIVPERSYFQMRQADVIAQLIAAHRL